MVASGRRLTPRTARSWWTKGFLPPPHRRWRRRGSETFWTEPDIVERAHAAFDLLRTDRQADFVIECLWLDGFAIEPRFVRAAYIRGIDHHMRAAHTGRIARGRADQRGHSPDDAVAFLGATLARRESTSAPALSASAHVRIVAVFLLRFYASGEEPECEESLAKLYETAAPCFPSGWSGDLLVSFAEFIRQKASLPAMRSAVASSSDHDLTRARRLARFIWGFFGRLGRAVPGATAFMENDACVWLIQDALRRAVPLMIVMLGDEFFRQCIADFMAHRSTRLLS